MGELPNPPNKQLFYESLDAIRQKIQEDNYHSAFEWAFVMLWQYQLLHHLRESETLSDERVALVEKLSWALFDAVYGDGDRVADDLRGVEALAEEVQQPD